MVNYHIGTNKEGDIYMNPDIDIGKKSITVAVHDGLFHADEIFAVSLLDIIFDVKIIRTRDESRLANADMRVDVGGKYNPDTFDFDHHQAGFNERHKSPNWFRYDEGPLRSGFGLVFLHYGKEAIRAIIPDATNSDVDAIFELVDKGLVAAIDCNDNGENDKFRAREFPYSNNSMSKFVALMNPGDNQDASSQLDAFYSTRTIIGSYLIKEIKSTSNMVISAKKFNEMAKELGDDEILILEKYMPYGYAYSRCPYANKIEMIVFPSINGNWMCISPKYSYNKDRDTYPATLKNGKPREYKHQAPEDICGLRDEELSKIVKIKDAVFVHSNGHLGACKTKKGAIKLAQYFIDYGRT